MYYTLDEKPNNQQQKILIQTSSISTHDLGKNYIFIIFTLKMFTDFYMGHNYSYLFCHVTSLTWSQLSFPSST